MTAKLQKLKLSKPNQKIMWINHIADVQEKLEMMKTIKIKGNKKKK